jgi:hypothetical protein
MRGDLAFLVIPGHSGGDFTSERRSTVTNKREFGRKLPNMCRLAHAPDRV